MESKMFAVNMNLLPVKVFWLFLGSFQGMMVFNSSLARQKGIPPDIVGVMWSMFPIFTVLILMPITNLADRFKIHRSTFLIALIVTLTAEAAICFGPDIIENKEIIPLKNVNISCQNGNIISIYNNTHLDWLDCGSDSNNSQNNRSSIKCSVDHKESSTLDASVLKHIENSAYNVPTENINPLNVIEEIHLINQSEYILCPTNSTLTCVNDCSSFEDEEKLAGSTMFEIIQYPSFWLFLLFMYIYESTSQITASFAITATLQLLGEDSHKFGIQRVWATIGWGTMTLVYGAAIDYFSEGGGGERYYTAGYSISMVFWVFAFVTAFYIKFGSEEEKEKETGSVLGTLKSFNVLIFLVNL